MKGYTEIKFFYTYIDNAFVDFSQEKPEHRVMFSRREVKRIKRLNLDKSKFHGYRKPITSLESIDIDSSEKEIFNNEK